MTSKEDFEKLINNLRDKLDETTVALVSEELLALLSNYNNGFDEYTKSIEEVEKLKGEKEELLKVNGKLYQRIGFDDEKKDDKFNEDDSKEDEEIKIEDKNQKGNRTHHDRVADTVDKKRAQQLGERDLVIPVHHTTTPHLANTGQHQVHGIVAQYRINRIRHLEPLPQGIDQQPPTETSDHIGE